MAGKGGSTPPLILASSSPRRRDLLAQIGVIPDAIESPDIDESPHKGELPRLYALRMAEEKARTVARPDGHIVLAGDTTVALGRRVLPPADNDAMVGELVGILSGRRHHVWSAVALIDAKGRMRSRITDTIVRFKRLSDIELAAYVASGEGRGKAGGYAIQGRAAALVDFLSGTYTGVVGLPLYEVRALLRSARYPVD